MADKVTNPGWISDVPVDVDVDSLHAFSMKIQAELDQNVVPNVNNVLSQLAGRAEYTPGDYTSLMAPDHEPGSNQTFGRDPRYLAAVQAGLYHQDCESRAQELLQNLQLGLQAIAWAADGIAIKYRSVEELNNMDLAKVGTFFKADSDGGGLTDQANADPSGVQ